MLIEHKGQPRCARGWRERGEESVEGEGGKYMSRQSDNKTTKQVRIDSGWHKLLKLRATEDGKTIRELLEGILSECWELEKDNEKK